MPLYSSLESLPTELYEAILDQIEPSELQHSTLALSLALPRSPVPLHQLFRHLRITSRSQIPQLWQRLAASKKADGDRQVSNWIESFNLDTFDSDADVLNKSDLLRSSVKLIPRIKFLHLNIGPTFGPEQVHELFERPQEHLSVLSLRFRPYVEKASYYQFLKGQYSDDLVKHMTTWPVNPSLTRVSMAQDPLPDSMFDPATSFAQPIVFFSLEIFRPFSTSPLARSITHLRIRVPSRPVVAQLLEVGAFPAVRVLDIGTSALGNPERVLPALLARHVRLEHLLLDGCVLSRERWRELARACALAGQSRSRLREKSANAWFEAMNPRGETEGTAVAGPLANNATNGAPHARMARPGRRGVAAPTFSIRATPVTSQSQAATSNTPIIVATDAPLVKRTKIRILPPLPKLATFSTTLRPPPDAEKATAWRAEFDLGWRGGVDVLLSARARLRASASAVGGHVRVMRFADETAQGEDAEHGLNGLVDVGLDEIDIWDEISASPKVCFGPIKKRNERWTVRTREDDDDDDEAERDPQDEVSASSSDEDAAGTPAPVPSPAPSQPATKAKEEHPVHSDGHVHSCGHELHGKAWDIYEHLT